MIRFCAAMLINSRPRQTATLIFTHVGVACHALSRRLRWVASAASGSPPRLGSISLSIAQSRTLPNFNKSKHSSLGSWAILKLTMRRLLATVALALQAFAGTLSVTDIDGREISPLRPTGPAEVLFFITH